MSVSNQLLIDSLHTRCKVAKHLLFRKSYYIPAFCLKCRIAFAVAIRTITFHVVGRYPRGSIRFIYLNIHAKAVANPREVWFIPATSNLHDNIIA